MVVWKQTYDYEDLRNRRMEENKRRMEELRLPHLTQALKPNKPPQMKRTQPRKIVTETVEVRRSNRVANLPAPVYKPDDVNKNIVAQGSSSKSPAMIKAVEIQSSLGTEHPSFIKMVKGKAATAFNMPIPLYFWKLFLPKTDCIMVIEDENGEINHVKYYARGKRFSAGWNKFVVGQNLLVGDVMVFHLVETDKFKVYIVRANDLKKADDLITRLNLEAH